MIDKLFKVLVDLIFGTARVKRKYQIANPMETILAADGSKGIVTTDNQEIKRGIEWITSQRAVIILTDKKIVCGKWIIPLENITVVELLKINSFFGNGQVLKLRTKDNVNYQFGMQLNSEWTNQHVLQLTLVEGQIKHSTFSIIVRLIAIGYLIYWLYERFI